MFSMNPVPGTKTVDPFEGISVTSSQTDAETGTVKQTTYGVIDAYYVGTPSQELAVGFSINGAYIGFRHPLDMNRAAREVLDVISNYFSVSGVSFRSTVEILGSYFELVQSMGGQPVGAVPTDRIVERLEKNYYGQFSSREDFLAKLREDYGWLGEERFQSRAARYRVSSTGNHYFELG